MLAANFISFLSNIDIYKKRFDDDFVDYMNSWWSALLMIVFAIIISMKQMVGSSISCWFPAEFPDAWAQYAENYCWVKNTYFVKTNETIPVDKVSREKAELSYYQWVPFVLAIQALMFYLPAMFWRLFNWQAGVNIESLVKIASEIAEKDVDKAEGAIAKTAGIFHRAVKHSESKKRNWSQQARRIFIAFSGNQRLGNYLTLIYMITKALYFVSIVAQIYIVRAFTGIDHTFYSVEMLQELFSGKDWHVTGHFPRITVCDFTVRVLGNWHKYTVQCVLSDNMLNEKIYIFIYFWLLMMATVTAMSFVYWFFRCVLQSGEGLLDKHINNQDKQYHLLSFRELHNSLKGDGIFILHLMSFNVSDVDTGRIINYLWQNQKSQRREDRPLLDSGPSPAIYPSLPTGETKV